MTAIAAWMRRGGNLSGLAVRVGVSRQALNQRMQRKLKTREPISRGGSSWATASSGERMQS